MQMKYYSTRGNKEALTSAEAIKRGIAPDGGLYMPETIPTLTLDEIMSMSSMSYSERAFAVLSKFLDDYNPETLKKICEISYNEERFGKNAAPVVKLSDDTSVLELWHGPTCAFKDMALQIMPRLLSEALVMTGEENTAFILVATSGDTGKAALEGYRDVDKVKILVFYPEKGVSGIQKLQMASQEGSNVGVMAIHGNFDDAQTGVKKIFSSEEIREKLLEKNTFLSSANSINWGRLAPQIVYYISAYCDMVSAGTIKAGDKIDVTVPTGNFGDIFAAYIAKKMGLPLDRLICASNKNKILSDFFETGVYDKRRDFYTTTSPSMDILISSNLERLLYVSSDSETVNALMSELSEKGVYKVSDELLATLKKDFVGAWCSEEECAETVKSVFGSDSYVIDPHTAVAVKCARDCMGDNKMLVVSTASPYKFAPAVLRALSGKEEKEEFDSISTLSAITGTQAPLPLASLKSKSVRFTESCSKEEMPEKVLEF
jgi:threonine synthase